MDRWSEEASQNGRSFAVEILEHMVRLRGGADPMQCHDAIDRAARHAAPTTIAHAAALAESLLHRLAEATGRTERQVLAAVLAEVAANQPDGKVSALEPKRAGRKRSQPLRAKKT